ncbi:MAG: hypothetical protein HN742_38490 [Lentisphaerae bacterium]|jgi:hypothetical protein|nr:hypothetical protein [Lentisphaerota bacterium]MBT4815607.1 hypothetical protein [Lentisphaerota bacterium]MBT5609272.1 hypothetical protein [Lentisphaerota bacterium]MBT7059434.1 hypothetical protein [Lentisphaerota bacterium]MBT7847818.1 hypothetical protein [Lentisphaerota bacterium]
MPTPHVLSELEDYCFLSDQAANSVFIIERDGRVWRYDETLPGGSPRARTPEQIAPYTLLSLADTLGPPPWTWCWRGGWEPTLCITSPAGAQAQLLAVSEELWVALPDTVRSFPGGDLINPSTFQSKADAARSDWEGWFASGLEPPSTDEWWDNAWRSSFVQARCIYGDCHPRYGVATYTEARSDGFPPTTLAMVAALLAYQHTAEARTLLSYYLDRFILPDGRIDYYGPAISEYGGLLSLAADAFRGDASGADWFADIAEPVWRIQTYLARCRDRWVSTVDPKFGLIMGSPEADTRSDAGAFFHNNMLAWRGLSDIAGVWRELRLAPRALEAGYLADDLSRRLHRAVAASRRPGRPLPTRVDKQETFTRFDESCEAAYANYRYYPEMLGSGFLGHEDALGIVQAREQWGGQEFGMTVFSFPEWGRSFDDWPICSYAEGLLKLGETERFLAVMNGHARHHHTQDTFTAYEAVCRDGSPRRARSDWCVPAQLALPRMLAWSVFPPEGPHQENQLRE